MRSTSKKTTSKPKPKTPVKVNTADSGQVETPEKNYIKLKTPSNASKSISTRKDAIEAPSTNLEAHMDETVGMEPASQGEPAKLKTPRAKRINSVPSPKFRKVVSQYPSKILWAKLAVRDFTIRCKYFTKHHYLPSTNQYLS